MQQEDETPTFFGIALNRLIAFLGPHIAWVAGAIATWVMGKTDIFATFDVSNESLAGAISQALVFGVVTLVVWLGQHKWLDGFQRWAYNAYEGIAATPAVVIEGHEPLPPEERQMASDPGATEDAVAGFEDGEPPVSG